MTDITMSILGDDTESQFMALFLAVLHANNNSITLSYEQLDDFETVAEKQQILISILPDDDKETMEIIATPIPDDVGRMN